MTIPQTIAIDVDDVLALSARGFVDFSNRRWGTSLTVEDYTERWALMWGVDHSEGKQRAYEIYSAGVVATFDKMSGAEAVLRRLSKKFRLVILTSRVKHVQKDTEDWINRHYPAIFDDIHYAGFYDDLTENSHTYTKADICKQIGADYLIDDHPKHCLAAAKAGIATIMFGDYAWNRNVEPGDNVYKATNWSQVEEYFFSVNAASFRDNVCTLVAQIPKGKVIAYGQIAAMCGKPRAARIVGGIAHFGDANLPWHRVVKKDGSLAEGYPGGVAGHQAALQAEGVSIVNGKVDMKECTWLPNL